VHQISIHSQKYPENDVNITISSTAYGFCSSPDYTRCPARPAQGLTILRANGRIVQVGMRTQWLHHIFGVNLALLIKKIITKKDFKSYTQSLHS
jgi:hypothetical protein